MGRWFSTPDDQARFVLLFVPVVGPFSFLLNEPGRFAFTAIAGLLVNALVLDRASRRRLWGAVAVFCAVIAAPGPCGDCGSATVGRPRAAVVLLLPDQHSTTSYGSYSGETPNEKITWEKLGAEMPKYMIKSDASIVAPLIFAYVRLNSSLKTAARV